ncbi:MAG TPA: hypothetical protein DEF13_06020, partial [Holosporales bacterium]|nr:hypothetical protein [Holosporales bacterium]
PSLIEGIPINAGVAYSGETWVAQPATVWHKSFTANRTDDNHPYIEVYCGKSIYYWYEGDGWKSQTYTWSLKDINCK